MKTSTSALEVKSTSSIKETFEQFYAKKFPHVDKQKCEKFSMFMVKALDRINALSENKPIQILTTSYNVSDGIGDFVNQADFTAWLLEFLKSYSNFQIKSFSILESGKFGLAKKLMPDIMKQRNTDSITAESKLSDFKQNTHNFLCAYATNMNFPVIHDMMRSADCVINLARYFYFHDELGELLSQFQPGCLVFSRGEYGPLGKKHADSEQSKIYYENCMGVTEDDAGVKFYPNIEAFCREAKDDTEKTKLLSSLENKNLEKTLAGEDASQYIKTNGFAFGYIQAPKYSVGFTRLMIAKSKNKAAGITVITNLAHFQNIKEDKNFLKQLQQEGYSHIQLINNDGSIQKIIETNTRAGKKVLKLVEFKGTSQADKEKMIAISDMVAGSGNSSFSEMLSAKKFPFVQPISHVRGFYNAFVAEISEHKIEHADLLKHYFKLNFASNWGEIQLDEMTSMVADQDVVSKLMHAWQQFCEILKSKRNAYDDFIEMITTFIIEKMLELDPEVSLSAIFDFFPEGKIGGTSILHMAIEKSLPTALKNLSQLNKDINLKCSYQDFTPLMVAARYRKFETSERLLEQKASLTALDSNGLTVIHQAVLKKDLEMLRLFAKYNPHFFLVHDADGNIPLIDAIRMQNKEMILLFKELDKKNEMQQKMVADSKGNKISLQEFAILNLNPKLLHIFGIGKDEKDTLGVAQHALEIKSADLFLKCCEAAIPEEKEKLKEIAIKNGLDFLETYIQHFQEGIYLDQLQKMYFSPFLKHIATPLLSESKLVDQQSKLQINLIHLVELSNRFLANDGRTIEPHKLTKQIFVAMHDMYRYATSLNKPILSSIILSIMNECVKACESDVKLKLLSEEIQRKMLNIKIQGWLDEYESYLSKMTSQKQPVKSGLSNLFSSFLSSSSHSPVDVTAEKKKVAILRDTIGKCSSFADFNNKLFPSTSKNDPLIEFLKPKWEMEFKGKSHSFRSKP